MARGKKTPSAIQKLQGTYRERERLDNEMAPPKISEEVEAPGKLVNKFAQEEWLRQTKVLSGLSMLVATDLSLLLSYCNECGTYYEAMDDIREKGFYEYKANSRMVSSAYTIANRSLANMIKLSDKFGFNPAARTKIEMPQQDNDDPFENL